ncbi:DUF309 domain-containing protein [Numidum massiliense]|uniref:DUF309 domain-containing protein n=1 Tax=Numidum massiliense TaxID=1522315 RepID=UPI0006D5834A|nr:DUF309 domain-containing protein [Numidum massiliense]
MNVQETISHDYPRRYIEFLYHFSTTRDFLQCHELLEELWVAEGRQHLFYQGLLQIATALHHFKKGNLKGARKLFRVGAEKTGQFPDEHLGIDVQQLTKDAKEYYAKITVYEKEPFDFYVFDIVIRDRELEALVAAVK